jgi:hypothetical protein
MTPIPSIQSSFRKHPLLTLAVALASASALPAAARAKDPSAESLNKLFKASEAQKTTVEQMEKVSKAVDAMVNEAVSKEKLTPYQLTELKKRLPDFSKSLKKIINEEMGWTKVRDSYATVYANNFTQEEIDAFVSFYQSAAGKAFLKKMPMVNEELTQAAIERLPIITERVQKASEDFLKTLQPTPEKK